MKKTVKVIGIAMAAIIVCICALLIYVTVLEYKPKDKESIETTETGGALEQSQQLTVLTYNIGYAGLSKDEDFFMDGGSKVRPDSKQLIYDNLDGIYEVLKSNPADIYLLQEVDLNSKRSYHVNQRSWLEEQLQIEGFFAYNFNSAYVPYPIPTIGKVESGLLTLTDLKLTSAERISLPVPFSWPVSTCNLKRCLLETRIPIQDSDRELVIYNLHLEAYDDGEGKIAQTNMLMSLLVEEYQKGNYVVAGGDFNQTFDSIEGYPIINKDDWVPGIIEESSLPDGFVFAVNDNYATCRLLSEAYSGNYEESQVFVIDGYIVSDNIEVDEIAVIDTQFEHSDHQPVKFKFTLKD